MKKNNWVCNECSESCWAETLTRCAPDGCLFGCDEKSKWEPYVPAAQPEPEPELMTMAQAIAKAVEMGGGEVWLDNEKRVTINKDFEMSLHVMFRYDKKFVMPIFTVRPLAPALLPCPFCKGEMVISKMPERYDKLYYFAGCTACKATSGNYSTEAEAIAAWNRREGSRS
jgi:Lar family restriction alleviation protein